MRETKWVNTRNSMITVVTVVVLLLLFPGDAAFGLDPFGEFQDCGPSEDEFWQERGVLAYFMAGDIEVAESTYMRVCNAEPDPTLQANCIKAVGLHIQHILAAQSTLVFKVDAGMALASQEYHALMDHARSIWIFEPQAAVEVPDLLLFVKWAATMKASLSWAKSGLNETIVTLLASRRALRTDPILGLVIHADVTLPIAFDLRDVFEEYSLCVKERAYTVVVAAALKFGAEGGAGNNPGGPLNPLGPMGDQSSGSGSSPLLGHPTFDGVYEDLWVGDVEHIEENGRVFRQFRLGYDSDPGAYLDEILHPFTGEVIVPADTPIVVMGGGSPWSDPDFEYEPIGGRLEIYGRDAAVHFEIPGAGPGGIPMYQVCMDLIYRPGGGMDMGGLGEPGMGSPGAGSPGGGPGGEIMGVPGLYPGEYARCTIRFDVTGSPDEVAAGEIAEQDTIVVHMSGNPGGEGDGLFKSRIHVSAPKESYSDPCYVWDYNELRYVFDSSLCDPDPWF